MRVPAPSGGLAHRAPVQAAPDEVAALQRVSTQPVGGARPEWYLVDLFVEDGEVRAVTVDLWEP